MCNCITQVNEQLKPFSTEVDVTITLSPSSVRAKLATFIPANTKTKKGQKPMGLTAAYCPFCGKKYESENEETP